MYFTNLLRKFLDVDSMASNQTSPSPNVMSYLDSTGVVESPIRIGKKGRIRLCGVYWFARSHSDRIIAIDEHVRVVSREGLTLIVVPIDTPQQLPLFWSEDKFPKSC